MHEVVRVLKLGEMIAVHEPYFTLSSSIEQIASTTPALSPLVRQFVCLVQ